MASNPVFRSLPFSAEEANANRSVDSTLLDTMRIIESPMYPAALVTQLHDDFPEADLLHSQLLELTYRLKTEPAKARATLDQLAQTRHRLDALAAECLATGRPHVELNEVCRALERRDVIWRLVVDALESNHYPIIELGTKTPADLDKLRKAVQEFKRFYEARERAGVGRPLVTQLGIDLFLQDLDHFCAIDENASNGTLPPVGAMIPLAHLVILCDWANLIDSRIKSEQNTPHRKRLLNSRTTAALLREIDGWRGDTVEPITLISALEQYESHRAPQEMSELYQLARRLSFSKSDRYRQLGREALRIYGDANLKVYVSEVLINHFLPASDLRETNFRDRVMGNPVVGKSRSVSILEVNLVPSDDELVFSLDMAGRINGSSRSVAWITTLFNDNAAVYNSSKIVRFTEDGVKLSPTRLRVNNRVQLRGIRTEIDNVPIFSGLVRELVRGQYEAREDQIRVESRQRTAAQLRAQIDNETSGRFNEFNRQYRDMLLKPMDKLGLYIENKGSATNTDWLLSSWWVGSDASLGSHAPAPATQQGAFADMKVHESVLNTVITQLELNGVKASVGELRQTIADKLGQPAFAEAGEHDDAVIAFAEHNPIIIRFIDSSVEIDLAIDMLKVNDRVFRNFGATIHYKPRLREDGQMYLVRDGIISLSGQIKSRSQIPLRAVFEKIFPELRPVPLTPAIFKADERLHGLAVGMCRIENGWFALAIVAMDQQMNDLAKQNGRESEPVRR